MKSINQQVALPLLTQKRISLYLKREDLIHPVISGNKYRKLKYNIVEAKAKCLDTLLTFGGAFSNHIVATACAGYEQGFQTVGIIRGEEIAENWQDNPTLALARIYGMKFKFISRERYRQKTTAAFLEEVTAEFGECYVLPEGGTNILAVKGCEEIVNKEDKDFDLICCCVGTGGTIAGIINASAPHQKILGFPALKGDFLKEDICNFVQKDNWALQTDYHFGGYAKISLELIDFINHFKEETTIPLDPVYTGKMMYGILELVKNNHFKAGTKILAIHTGGLQAIKGMNTLMKNKDLPLLIL